MDTAFIASCKSPSASVNAAVSLASKSFIAASLASICAYTPVAGVFSVEGVPMAVAKSPANSLALSAISWSSSALVVLRSPDTKSMAVYISPSASSKAAINLVSKSAISAVLASICAYSPVAPASSVEGVPIAAAKSPANAVALSTISCRSSVSVVFNSCAKLPIASFILPSAASNAAVNLVSKSFIAASLASICA